jgi:hypothetical protein
MAEFNSMHDAIKALGESGKGLARPIPDFFGPAF